MSEQILNEDWSDYDNKKKKGVDAKFFSCEEDWEVNYLVDKITKRYNYSAEKVRAAIKSCCETVKAPRPRKVFVECVMNRLK